MLQPNLKIAHNLGSVNAATYFLSQPELKVLEQTRFKIDGDIRTSTIK